MLCEHKQEANVFRVLPNFMSISKTLGKKFMGGKRGRTHIKFILTICI